MAKAKPTTSPKSDQQPKQKTPMTEDEWQMHAKELARDLWCVLENPVCPMALFKAIGDALSEIQSHSNCLSSDFLYGLFSAARKEGAKQRLILNHGRAPARLCF